MKSHRFIYKEKCSSPQFDQSNHLLPLFDQFKYLNNGKLSQKNLKNNKQHSKKTPY